MCSCALGGYLPVTTTTAAAVAAYGGQRLVRAGQHGRRRDGVLGVQRAEPVASGADLVGRQVRGQHLVQRRPEPGSAPRPGTRRRAPFPSAAQHRGEPGHGVDERHVEVEADRELHWTRAEDAGRCRRCHSCDAWADPRSRSPAPPVGQGADWRAVGAGSARPRGRRGWSAGRVLPRRLSEWLGPGASCATPRGCSARCRWGRCSASTRSPAGSSRATRRPTGCRWAGWWRSRPPTGSPTCGRCRRRRSPATSTA